MQYDVDYLNKVTDGQGQPCPKELCQLLHKAGIVRIGCGEGRLDWDLIRRDVQGIMCRLGHAGDAATPDA